MEEPDYRGIPSKQLQWGATRIPHEFDYGYAIFWFPCRADAVTFVKSQGWTHYAIARAWGFE